MPVKLWQHKERAHTAAAFNHVQFFSLYECYSMCYLYNSRSPNFFVWKPHKLLHSSPMAGHFT